MDYNYLCTDEFALNFIVCFISYFTGFRYEKNLSSVPGFELWTSRITIQAADQLAGRAI